MIFEKMIFEKVLTKLRENENILFLFKIVSYKKQISFVLKWAKLTRSYLLRELCRNNSLGFKFVEKRKKKKKNIVLWIVPFVTVIL